MNEKKFMNALIRGFYSIFVRIVWLACPVVFAAAPSMETICGKCVPARFATCGGFLEGASIDPSGALWVVDISGDRILNITDEGKCVTRAKAGGSPAGSKFTKDGRMFIAAAKGLLSFDPRTSNVSVVVNSFEGQPLLHIDDLVLDKDEGVYFTQPNGSNLRKPVGRVFYLAPGATTPLLFADHLAFPNGVALSTDGRLVLVSEFAAKRILTFPAIGAKKGRGGGPPLSYVYAYTQGGVGADGIAVDSKGRLFAACITGGEVEVFGADTVHIGFIRFPDDAGKNVTNLVFRNKDKYLYFTEAQKGEVWRVRINN
jgi:gluconolactonase